MASLNQIQRRTVNGQISGVVRFFSGVSRAIVQLGTLRANTAEVITEATVAQPSEALARAVETNSNLEMDWLWAATQMSRVSEQRYCLRRALEINPASEMALRELGRIGW